MSDGKVVFEIKGDPKGINSTLKDVTANIEKESKKWDDAAEKSTASMDGTFKSFLKGLVGAFSAAGIAKIILDWGKASVQAASDLAEVQNVVDVTFGDSSKKIESWAQKAGKNYGLTETQAKKYTSTIGAMMKSQGIVGDQIVDIDRMEIGLMRADEQEAPPLKHSEHLEHAYVARPIGGAGAHDHHAHARPGHFVPAQIFGLKLAFLIGVARIERGIFVGRGRGDIAMHADRGTIDEAFDARFPACRQQRASAVAIDLHELAAGAFGPEHGGDVETIACILQQRVEPVRVGQRALDPLDAAFPFRFGQWPAGHRSHAIAHGDQPPGQRTADEAGSAGYRDDRLIAGFVHAQLSRMDGCCDRRA